LWVLETKDTDKLANQPNTNNLACTDPHGFF